MTYLNEIYKNKKIIISGYTLKISDLNNIKTSELDSQIKIRLPKIFKKLIEIESQKNGRSKAAEILHRLRVSFIKNIDISETQNEKSKK